MPEAAAGMRLDRFLAQWFPTWSRTALARAVRAGEVLDAQGNPMRPAQCVKAGDVLKLTLQGIAPEGEPPPLPPVLHEDARVVALNKPSGLMTHPAGDSFVWSVIDLARRRWPSEDLHLAHRLDRDTSGVLLLARDVDAARTLKGALQEGVGEKVYDALVRGSPPWEEIRIDEPIGPANGPIRIQMAVTSDGLPARTEVRVRERRGPLTWVECHIHTGRTHQIRVHLAHVGHAVVGDRMYGLPPEVFLRAWEQGGVDEATFVAAGARRHALHARSVRLPHPDGGDLAVEAPWPEDMTRWLADPSVLPLG